MTRTYEKPQRGGSGLTKEGSRETHPAYAMIGAYRQSSGPPGVALFGSDFRHQHSVSIKIVEADVSRDVNHDWPHGGRQIIEVVLSEAQWATFVATPNVGYGVQCTLEYVRDVGEVPGIIPIVDRKVQFHEEIDARLQRALANMDELAAEGATKAAREKARYAAQEIRSNLPYIAQSYDEHAEKTIEKMKIEVAAYIGNAIQRAGITALGGQPEAFLQLAEADEETDQ